MYAKYRGTEDQILANDLSNRSQLILCWHWILKFKPDIFCHSLKYFSKYLNFTEKKTKKKKKNQSSLFLECGNLIGITN